MDDESRETGLYAGPLPRLAEITDRVQLVAVGTGAPNAPCVISGPNGKADTAAPAGDDTQVLTLGSAQANQPVIRCGR
jgi:hypothetical protein